MYVLNWNENFTALPECYGYYYEKFARESMSKFPNINMCMYVKLRSRIQHMTNVVFLPHPVFCKH